MSRRNRSTVTLTPTGSLTTRERLWRAMRDLKSFCVPELARKAGVDRHKYNVSDYLRGLVKAGILAVDAPASPGKYANYTLVRDMGVDAPRVRRDGSTVPEPAQQTMWRGMKILREFAALDLVAHAEMAGITIKPSTAQTYCQWLARGGYLTPLRTRPGESARYRFVGDTGPKAPRILRIKALYDVNIGEIMTGQELDDALDESDAVAIRKGERPANGWRAEGAA